MTNMRSIVDTNEANAAHLTVLDDEARNVVERAMDYSSRSGWRLMSSNDLLVALLDTPSVVRLVQALGHDPSMLQQNFVNAATRGGGTARPSEVVLAESAKQAFHFAIFLRAEQKASAVSAEHLFVGALRASKDDEFAYDCILRSITPEKVTAWLQANPNRPALPFVPAANPIPVKNPEKGSGRAFSPRSIIRDLVRR